MTIAVEITLYALTEGYVPEVDEFLERVNTYEGILVITNHMSTRLIGEYDVVMNCLQAEMKGTFERKGKYSFVKKVLNDPILDGVLDR